MAILQSPSPSGEPSTQLGHSLRKRHVTMILLVGIIGAGLFVGSSATISAMGPAACLSYLPAGIVVLFVMRMLGELALAHPGVGSFTEFTLSSQLMASLAVVSLAYAVARSKRRAQMRHANSHGSGEPATDWKQ